MNQETKLEREFYNSLLDDGRTKAEVIQISPKFVNVRMSFALKEQLRKIMSIADWEVIKRVYEFELDTWVRK